MMKPCSASAVEWTMIPTAKSKAAAGRDMNRRVICIDVPPERAGITAALRHAFSARDIDGQPAADEFDNLLKRIH